MAASERVGGVIAALMGKVITPSFGWRANFLIAGVPLLALPVLYRWLPESISYLIACGGFDEADPILWRYAPQYRGNAASLKSSMAGGVSRVARLRAVELFAQGRAADTLPLWVAFGMCMLMVYGLNTWLPKLSARFASRTRSPWEGRIFSNGWVAATGGTAPVVEPSTGETLASIGIGLPEDIDRAASSAFAAQHVWAAMPFDQRAAIMREVARLLKERADEITEWNVRECGSTRAKAEWELHATYEQLQMAAAMPMQPDGQLYPSAMRGRMNLCRHVPVGVVGVIAPWNCPILLAMRSVAPALAVGNTVILKPDPQSALAGGLLLAKVFEDAGLPTGVFHVVPGGPSTGDALVRHPKVGMISFTGSTSVGRSIGQVCGQMLKKVALELGGNNAIVVLECRCGSGNFEWCVGRVSPSGADLHADGPPPRASFACGAIRGPACRAREETRGG